MVNTHRDTPAGLRAVVIGAGFAGLSATAGLSKLFDNVVWSPVDPLRARERPWKVDHPSVTCQNCCDLQTLLDRDDLRRGVTKAEALDPVTWRQEYEVHRRSPAGSGMLLSTLQASPCRAGWNM